MKYLSLILTFCFACAQAQSTKHITDREHDGFVGPVKKVFEEWSPISGDNADVPVGSRCRQMTSVYDQSGRLMQHSIYPGSCGSDEIREDYAYGQDGSRTKKTAEIRGKDSPPPPPGIAGRSGVKEAGEPRTVFKYDPSGKLVEETLVSPGGRVLYKANYSYDAKGRMTEEATTYSEGDVVRRVYSYSGDARVPSEFKYIEGNGTVSERTTYSDYEFNPRGDWIKRKDTTEETRNRRSVSWRLRTIEYYP